MPNRSWRSGNKQPPQQREPQKESRKTLEDTCKGLKVNFAMENVARISAEKRKQDQELEDEQMRMIYGPNWRSGLPDWALEREKTPEPERVPFSYEPDDQEEDQVIPFPKSSETRLSRRRRAS